MSDLALRHLSKNYSTMKKKVSSVNKKSVFDRAPWEQDPMKIRTRGGLSPSLPVKS